MNNVFGYVRVSSKDQNEARQIAAMKEFNVPEKNIFMDKQSGKDFDRPEYQKLINTLSENDLLLILSIDRLGRNYEEIQHQWRIITKELNADIFVIDMPLLDTRRGKDLMGTFIADLVLQVLSFVAETERDHIKQRQAEGIAEAKKRGVRFGRPPRPLPENFEDVYDKWIHRELSIYKASKLTGMPVSTFRYRAERYRKRI